MKKKFFAASALLCAGIMSISLAACGSGGNATEATSFVTLDINPSIEFTLDKKDRVISVYGANEDGQVLLYGEEGIVGAKVDVAVEKVTGLAIELGYLDGYNAVVETSVTSAQEGLAENLSGKINAKVTVTAEKYNLSVSCEGNTTYSLLRKLEQLKEQYPDNSAIQSLTADRLKLILSANATGEISVEAAAELDNDELIQFISDAHAKVEEYATYAYNEAKVKALAAYDEAVGMAIDGIYTTYYTAHHPMNVYYGYSYQSYKTSARALDATADLLAIAEKAGEYPLNEVQIAAVAQALGMGENVDALKNSDGEITVNSIYAYADKLFKNSEASSAIETMKNSLDAALDTVESELQAKIEELSAEYKTEIEETKAILESTAEQINGMLALLPESAKAQLNAMVSDCREIAEDAGNMIADGRVTSDEVRNLAVKLEGKAAATLEMIENDLTEEELAEVKQLQEKAMETLTTAKQKMENAINQAEKQAKEKLEALKAERSSLNK